MSAADAAIWIDPARCSGAPCIYGTRLTIETVAGYVESEGVDTFMHDYEITSRRDVLVACAWWTLYWPVKGDRRERETRKRWSEWAANAWGVLWNNTPKSTDAVPDPPSREPS